MVIARNRLVCSMSLWYLTLPNHLIVGISVIDGYSHHIRNAKTINAVKTLIAYDVSKSYVRNDNVHQRYWFDFLISEVQKHKTI